MLNSNAIDIQHGIYINIKAAETAEADEEDTGDEDENEDGGNNRRDDPDCWYDELYVCDENGKCDSEKFDCIRDCLDGSTVVTGTCCYVEAPFTYSSFGDWT